MKPLELIRLPAMLSLLSCTLMSAQPVQAQTWTSYDTFDAAAISPARWYGEEGKQYGGTRTEAQRAIVSKQLRIGAKGYSDNYSNTSSSSVRNSLIFANSSTITGMRSVVTMRTATAGACAANPSASLARARLFGFFFNAGIPVPGSNYNDVFAGIQLQRASDSAEASDVLHVFAFVGICTDDNCIGSSSLASQDLGTTTLTTPVDLSVIWDAGNNRFTFQRDTDTPVNLAYTVADKQPASYPAKRLEISNTIAHCTASRLSSNGVADFNNAMIISAPAVAASARQRADSEPTAAFDNTIGRVN